MFSTLIYELPMAFWNRKYKDSVFTDLFGTDKTGKENFLDLYNALSGNDMLKRYIRYQIQISMSSTWAIKNSRWKKS